VNAGDSRIKAGSDTGKQDSRVVRYDREIERNQLQSCFHKTDLSGYSKANLYLPSMARKMQRESWQQLI
jgi:hypothetical protein